MIRAASHLKRTHILLPLALLLAACTEQADGTSRLDLSPDTVQAQLVAKQAAVFTKAAVSTVRPYITGERELAALANERVGGTTLGAFAQSSEAMTRSMISKLESVELDGTRPLGACRDAVVSFTSLLADAHSHAQAGRALTSLLPLLDQADLHVRNCAETSARLGMPLISQP